MDVCLKEEDMRYEYKFVDIFKSVSPTQTLDEEKINAMGQQGYRLVNVFIKPGFPAMHQVIMGIFEKQIGEGGEVKDKPKRGRPKKSENADV